MIGCSHLQALLYQSGTTSESGMSFGILLRAEDQDQGREPTDKKTHRGGDGRVMASARYVQ